MQFIAIVNVVTSFMLLPTTNSSSVLSTKWRLGNIQLIKWDKIRSVYIWILMFGLQATLGFILLILLLIAVAIWF